MRSRQIAQTLVLLAGISILALLITPAVHVPFVVLHGPMSALRAQRAASLLAFALWAAAFLFAGLLIGWYYYTNSLSDRELQDAIAEADTERPIDSHPQSTNNALLARGGLFAHIPSSPSSSRARSITSGVISPIERSRA